MLENIEFKAKPQEKTLRPGLKELASKNRAAGPIHARRFVIPAWHRPYAVVLLETNVRKLPALIAAAKREILARYIDGLAAPMSAEEFLDLRNATEVLAHIERRLRIHGQVR
jgi:hypothetical protein